MPIVIAPLANALSSTKAILSLYANSLNEQQDKGHAVFLPLYVCVCMFFSHRFVYGWEFVHIGPQADDVKQLTEFQKSTYSGRKRKNKNGGVWAVYTSVG